jgi:hypothetical protein
MCRTITACYKAAPFFSKNMFYSFGTSSDYGRIYLCWSSTSCPRVLNCCFSQPRLRNIIRVLLIQMVPQRKKTKRFSILFFRFSFSVSFLCDQSGRSFAMLIILLFFFLLSLCPILSCACCLGSCCPPVLQAPWAQFSLQFLFLFSVYFLAAIRSFDCDDGLSGWNEKIFLKRKKVSWFCFVFLFIFFWRAMRPVVTTRAYFFSSSLHAFTWSKCFSFSFFSSCPHSQKEGRYIATGRHSTIGCAVC